MPAVVMCCLTPRAGLLSTATIPRTWRLTRSGGSQFSDLGPYSVAVLRHPLHPALLVVVAVGGAAGAALRWALEAWQPAATGGFPWATFGINVAGSMLLALLPASALIRRHPLLPPALGTGMLGGFTTLSTYSEETRALLAAGHTGSAATYVVGSVAACLLGVALVDRFVAAPAREEFDADEGDR
jgi:CrcB protein